jgi:hypothetical protein
MADYSSFYRYQISLADVQRYEMIDPQLDALKDEFNALKSKKPDAPVSKAKIRMVNAVLADALELVKDLPEAKYLALLNEDDIPQVSDVAMLLAQVEKAMNRYSILHRQDREWFLTKEDAKKVNRN